METGGTPEVSVRVVTYNHGQFIADALESAIHQKTSFDFEIVIGEDQSTDDTRSIVKEYEEKYPGLLRVKYHEVNRGRQFNYYDTLSRCRGRYIALLDGDDYWISQDKLQIQYEFLEEHKEYPLCFHNNKVEWADGSQPVRTVIRDKSTYTLDDMLRTNYVMPSAAMFRAELIPEISSVYDGVPFCDWPFYLAMARQGPLYAIPEVMGVKRVQGQGVWTSMSKQKQLQSTVDFYLAVLQEGLFDETVVNDLIEQTQALIKQRSIKSRLIDRLKNVFNGE